MTASPEMDENTLLVKDVLWCILCKVNSDSMSVICIHFPYFYNAEFKNGFIVSSLVFWDNKSQMSVQGELTRIVAISFVFIFLLRLNTNSLE